MTVYSDDSSAVKKTVVDLWELEITEGTQRSLTWQQNVGNWTIVICGIVLIFGKKKSTTA
jgi:hypothetical protein